MAGRAEPALRVHAAWMASMANINDMLVGHVALEVECVDRLILNAYVPALQVPGHVVRFLGGHLGYPIPSPSLLGRIGSRFRAQTRRFAHERGIPVPRLAAPDRSRWDDRKVDHVRPHLRRAEREGRFGVVALVVAEQFRARLECSQPGARAGPRGDGVLPRAQRVGAHYFYILEPEFGLGFIKICTYTPYSAKVWLNGHEWANRQALRQGLGYTELENAFASCADPERLPTICDSFSPEHVQAFFDRWITRIPAPLTEEDRAAGYWWERAVHAPGRVSRTLVLDDPRRARSFFDALVDDNVGIGRAEEISLVFARRAKSPGDRFPTRIASRGTEVRVDFRYKHPRIKQYLKDGRALRIETVINRPDDLGVARRLQHLPELVSKACQANQRPLITEQAGQSCAIGSALFERIHQPYNRLGQKNRSPALRGHTSSSPGRRPVHRSRRRHRLHQQKPAPTRRRTPRPGLQPQSDELRPQAPCACTDSSNGSRAAIPTRSPLKASPSPRCTPSSRTAPATAAGRRQTTGQDRDPPRAQNARTRRRRIRPKRQARPDRINSSQRHDIRAPSRTSRVGDPRVDRRRHVPSTAFVAVPTSKCVPRLARRGCRGRCDRRLDRVCEGARSVGDRNQPRIRACPRIQASPRRAPPGLTSRWVARTGGTGQASPSARRRKSRGAWPSESRWWFMSC